MAETTGSSQRRDPYATFGFRVRMDGRYVAAFRTVGARERTTEVVEHREGRGPEPWGRSPGRTEYEAITLERGVTHDPEFETWASAVWNAGPGPGAEVPPKALRRDVVIERYDEAGQRVLTYRVHRAWVSRYQAVPELDANANAVAIEMLTLENEGWERADDVAEPSEPSLGESGA